MTRYATARLAGVPGVTIHGPAAADKVGVVPFSVAGFEHALVAAVLADEHGIGVRSGCFCAHPYVAHLLGLDADGAAAWARRVGAATSCTARPALVRLSLGGYTDCDDIDRAVAAIRCRRRRGGPRLLRRAAGRFVPPAGGRPPLPARFAF